MSSRYGNRKCGRGGFYGDSFRGRGRSTPRKRHTKETVEDYVFHVVSSDRISDYGITDYFTVNHVKKTFDIRNDVS